MPHLDVFGHRGSSEATRQQFLIADLQRSIHVHQTTLELDADTRAFGGSIGQLIVVSDGLQPNGAGGQAGRLALEAVAEYLLNAFGIAERQAGDEQGLRAELTEAIQHCHQKLQQHTSANAQQDELQVELTAVFVIWPEAFVIRAGQTACDHWRSGNLYRLTKDGGEILLGTASDLVDPGFARFSLQAGDRLLVSTRGLSDALPVHEITQMVGRPDRAEQICRHLVDAASVATDSSHAAVVVCIEDQPPAAQVATSKAQSQPVENEQPAAGTVQRSSSDGELTA